MAYLVIIRAFPRIITGDKNTCGSASSPSTSLIAGIGLAVSAIAQPAVPAKEMVVTPFEQVKLSYRSDKPHANQIAVAERDPAKGPCSRYLKFKKGVNPTSIRPLQRAGEHAR